MGVQDDHRRPSARQVYEETLSGTRPPPLIPRLRSDPPNFTPIPHSLREFRAQEGEESRRKRLRALWSRLPRQDEHHLADDEAVARAHPVKRDGDLTAESARELDEMYEDELLGRCTRGPFSRRVSWPEFEKYAEAKETGASVRAECADRVAENAQSCGIYFTTNLTWMAMAIWKQMSCNSRWRKLVCPFSLHIPHSPLSWWCQASNFPPRLCPTSSRSSHPRRIRTR